MRVGYEMVDSQRGARRRVDYNHLISNERASEIIVLLKEGLNWGGGVGGGPLVACRLRFSYFVGSRLKFSVVG